MAIRVASAHKHVAVQGSAARQRPHAPSPSRPCGAASRGTAALSGCIAPSGSGMAAGVLVLTAAALAVLVQRARASWRVTAHERTMPLPGDGLVPHPLLETTHAVTIHASRQQVWPWLVQLGQGRAGFYADSPLWDRFVDWYYRLLSREQGGAPPVGYRVGASDQIVPAWQNPRVGDIIADGPPGTASYVVRQVEQDQAFVLFTETHLRYLLPARLRDTARRGIRGELSASYLLTEPEPGTTRLVRRMRLSCSPWPFRMLVVPIVLLWGESLTARHFLRGVKRRAEAQRPAADRAPHPDSQPMEVAPGVYALATGPRFFSTNVYFVRSGTAWALIDAGWATSGRLIKEAAAALCGADTRPAALLLTHVHPDHAGAALELAQAWDCPVFIHAAERPLTAGTLTALEGYPVGPLDRWLILPLLRALPTRQREAIMAAGALKERAQPFDPRAGVPGLPDWVCVPTPGHSPGHVSFFRPHDRVLIAGDALVTVQVNAVWGLLRQPAGLSGPPWYTTANWRAAQESVRVLARLAPRVVAPGHGPSLSGPDTARAVQAFADRFARRQSRG